MIKKRKKTQKNAKKTLKKRKKNAKISGGKFPRADPKIAEKCRKCPIFGLFGDPPPKGGGRPFFRGATPLFYMTYLSAVFRAKMSDFSQKMTDRENQEK